MTTTAALLLALDSGAPTGWSVDGHVWQELKDAVHESGSCSSEAGFSPKYEVREDEVWLVGLRRCDELALVSMGQASSFQGGATRASWVDGEMVRYIPPWIQPAVRPPAPNGWAGMERLQVAGGRVTAYTFEPHPDFVAGFRWHTFEGTRLLVPADLESCGEGCLARDDLEIRLEWKPGVVPKKERALLAASLLQTTRFCERACDAQLPSGARRTLIFVEEGYVDARIRGDFRAAFFAGGALMGSVH